MKRDGQALIVDPDAGFLTWAARVLGDTGFAVTGTDGVETAERLLGLRRPDVLIASADARGNTDLGFVRRATAAWPEMPVLVVSARPTEVAAGLQEVVYLVKPVDAVTLATHAAAAARRSRALRAIGETRDRLDGWSRDLVAMHQAMRAGTLLADAALDAFGLLVARRVDAVLADARSVLDTLALGERAGAARPSVGGRPPVVEALHRAVAVFDGAGDASVVKGPAEVRRRLPARPRGPLRPLRRAG